jgi:hypothetical protein
MKLKSKLLCAALFLVFLTLGIGLRFYQLNRQSLWQDEIHTVLYVNDHPSIWKVVYRVATWDLHSPLYYVLLRMQVWVQQSLNIQPTEGNLRLLSVLLGCLTLPAIYLLFFKIYKNNGWALAALGLAAVNIYGIYYSQEIRMYALVLLLAPLVLFFRLGIWRADNGKLNIAMVIGYILCSVGVMYTSLVGVFFVFGVWFSAFMWGWLDRRRFPQQWLQALLVGGVILFCYLPWLGVLWRQSMALKNGVWTGLIIDRPRELFKFAFENLLFHSWKIGLAGGAVNKAFRLLSPLVFLNLLDRQNRRAHGIILTCFALTFLTYYVITFHKPFHTGRYFSPWWPFAIYLILGIISGLEACLKQYLPKFRWVAWITAAVLALGYYYGQVEQIKYYFTKYEKENWREAAVYLNHNNHNNDVLLAWDQWDKEVLNYYKISIPLISREDYIRGKWPPGAQRILYIGALNPLEKGRGVMNGFNEIIWPFLAIHCYEKGIAK